jgi:hypothetical protein
VVSALRFPGTRREYEKVMISIKNFFTFSLFIFFPLNFLGRINEKFDWYYFLLSSPFVVKYLLGRALCHNVTQDKILRDARVRTGRKNSGTRTGTGNSIDQIPDP